MPKSVLVFKARDLPCPSIALEYEPSALNRLLPSATSRPCFRL